mgnify:CR=1 FL=1
MPNATPTLAELATIAHTHRCSVVATHHRRVLLDDTTSPLPFLGVRFGPAVKAVAARIGPADHRAIVVAVNRSGEAIAYDPTTDRIDSDVHRLTALDPARRTALAVRRVHVRAVSIALPGFGPVLPVKTEGVTEDDLIISFNINEVGKAVNIERIQFPVVEAIRGPERVIRRLRATRFRPVFEDGRPVASETITVAFDKSLWARSTIQ